ncbi:peptidyl-prolyl cis-trans isomerase cyclophilin type [Desulfovibrio sp. X2]|uniref:peptidylprolyl isomerase n=1 Tax=Desulfovibrio sp. X2 TaxID=941449 RepID=UPI00035890E3|nr:peptidylprolyl isomerase [Desulfovibrio sp. X2]EPR38700.1 peptidyl-prolyl cis-trans isomerase cyclophilin type [Desulfovibrio sp. X2]
MNMLRTLCLTFALVTAFAVSARGQAPAASGAQAAPGVTAPAPAQHNPHVLLSTTQGDMLIELWPEVAPKTVANFLHYVNTGRYDMTIFHRIIRDFVIQGGGYDGRMQEVETFDPVKNESRVDVKNLRGTVSMARTSDPDSATNQFFINVVNNEDLDKRANDPKHPGYCVFGKIVKGMATVERLNRLQVKDQGNFSNVPVDPAVILSAKQVD